MSARNWTPAQRDAINARRGTLLVSAAAGSGKTAVLVQRVIERLTDPVFPSDADHLLVVTFTKAAAAEMQERISQRLAELLAENPGDFRLQRQQILLNRAHISTIHSFCSDLIRENFYELDISPDFRIADDSEMALLRSDAAGKTLEEYYGKDDPIFSNLVESFSSDRNDDRLVRTINTLYDFIRSHPFPEKWLREKSEMYALPVSASETLWGKSILNYALEAVEFCVSLTKNSLSIMLQDEKLSLAYTDSFSDDLRQLSLLQEVIRGGEWDKIVSALSEISFTRLKVVRLSLIHI